MAALYPACIPIIENVSFHRLNQIRAAIFVSLSGFALGVSMAWNSSAEETLRNVLKATSTEIGLVGAVLNVGACSGVMAVPYTLKFFNRTNTILLTLPLYLVGWVLICLADQNVWIFVFGRFLNGVAGGISCVLSPIFIAEIADKNSRVRLLTYYQTLLTFGIFYAFLAAYMLRESEAVWRYSLLCGVSCAPIVLVGFVRESPLYWLTENNDTAASQSLDWYRSQDHHAEMQELKKLVQKRGSTAQIMKNRRVVCKILVCLLVMVTQQISGINTFLFHAVVIFNNGGSGQLSGSQQTLVVGAVQIGACLLCSLLIDIVGRRVLLAVSGIFAGIFMILQGWYVIARDNDPQYYDEVHSWMPPTWIALIFTSFNLGLGPISWSLLGDSFPQEVKIPCAVSGALLSWALSLVGALTFGQVAESLGAAYSMWLFGGSCCLGGILCGLFVIETDGRSLLDIQEAFVIEPTHVQVTTQS